ncbi:MAG TPA: YbfB/YjiJ family MFS transporter [Caldimonas sp.]|jgi:MFS family permease|nr:YbfB/YjiJ family MFS transporter [Caldimonas sp.]
MADQSSVSVRAAAGLGLASLAAAMGIGRFAFTPILPLMQEALGVTLGQGAWLATANYVGYLLGALASFVLPPRAGVSAKWGLLAVALSTLAMAFTSSLPVWLFLRLVAGIASAFVLVGASAWALAHLAASRRAELAGWVFAGVGVGICVAGCVALFASTSGGKPEHAWAALGAGALAVVVAAWRRLSAAAPAYDVRDSRAAQPLDRSAWLLVVCYGAFGFGYILPATFIPAAARSLFNDPLVFGWAWPLFGVAAAVSTVLVTTIFRSSPPRRTAAVSLLVMAAGVAAPLVHASLRSLAISAVCVGGTFMVMTMAGVQEARRIAGGEPTKLIAALTAAFAVGQLAGPVVVRLRLSERDPFTLPSAVAVALLLGSAVALLLTEEERSRVDDARPPAAALARGHDRSPASGRE